MINDNPLSVLSHSFGGDAGAIASQFPARDGSSATDLSADDLRQSAPQVDSQPKSMPSNVNPQPGQSDRRQPRRGLTEMPT
jgi:hypothetical protein